MLWRKLKIRARIGVARERVLFEESVTSEEVLGQSLDWNEEAGHAGTWDGARAESTTAKTKVLIGDDACLLGRTARRLGDECSWAKQRLIVGEVEEVARYQIAWCLTDHGEEPGFHCPVCRKALGVSWAGQWRDLVYILERMALGSMWKMN